jgi:hypothetical protein
LAGSLPVEFATELVVRNFDPINPLVEEPVLGFVAVLHHHPLEILIGSQSLADPRSRRKIWWNRSGPAANWAENLAARIDALAVHGLSQKTWAPASSAAMARSACSGVGVAIQTSSGRVSSIATKLGRLDTWLDEFRDHVRPLQQQSLVTADDRPQPDQR